MILYVNQRNEIKDVNSTTDTSLTALEVADTSENPFRNWSVAKICCYKVNVKDGSITMYTPYVDSRIVDHIDQLGKQLEEETKSNRSVIDYVAMMANVDLSTE